MTRGKVSQFAFALAVAVALWLWLRPRQPLAPVPAPTPLPSPQVPKAPGKQAVSPPKAPVIGGEEVPAKVALLKSILASANDNDPRLDTDFRDLTPTDKGALIAYYASLPQDRINERGTVVFLLGRSIRQPEDFKFFGQVLSETIPSSGTSDGDEEAVSPGLMHAYPQVMAVRALGKLVGETKNPQIRDLAIEQLRSAAHNPSPDVSRRAKQVLEKGKF